jgi:hypothetical protein
MEGWLASRAVMQSLSEGRVLSSSLRVRSGSFGRPGGRGSSIFERRQPARRCVRTALIVVLRLGLDLGSDGGERQERVRIDAPIAKATLEPFHMCFVGGLDRPAKGKRPAVLALGPISRIHKPAAL